MTNKTIGFIGGGRITRIFLAGWKRAGMLPGKVVVSDCNADALAKLKSQFPVKPLAEMETQVTEMYRTRLPAIFQKIKP
jgi:pyrroline-5-carboxylate reductase